MKYKALLLSFLLAGLTLSACNTNKKPSTSSGESTDSSGSSEDPKPATKLDVIKNKILSEHNYTMKVHSYCLEYSEDVYDDVFVNINDKIYYNNYYSGVSGKIYQKDQGYINFVYAGSNFIYKEFYSTNKDAGISSLYDLVGENLFLGEYVQDGDNDSRFYTEDFDSIAVASNFTGFNGSTWFVAPERLYVNVVNDTLVFDVNFDMYIINEGEQQIYHGYCSLTFENIGCTTNAPLEAYVENPTHVFEPKTNWDAGDVLLFNSYFNGLVPSFLTDSSYSIDIDTREDYLGTHILITDMASGDLTTSYGNKLVSSDGFSKVLDTSYPTYKRVDVDTAHQKTTTYTIEMVYLGSDADIGRRFPCGYYYPKGLFQLQTTCKTVNNTVNSVATFNSYLTANGYSRFIPLLPFGEEVTKISNFEDKTGTDYYFRTKDYVRIHIANYAVAKAAITQYAALLEEAGFHKDPSYHLFGTRSYVNADDFITDSQVFMSDADDISETSYQGFFEISFKVYEPKGDEPTYPLISLSSTDHISSYHFEDSTGKSITEYDSSIGDGTFYTYFTSEQGYNVTGLSLQGDSDATISYDHTNDRWSVKPSKDDLEEIVLIPNIGEHSNYFSIKQADNVTISYVSPVKEGFVNKDEHVGVSVVPASGYEIVKVYLEEDPTYPVTKTLMSENVYEFVMPDFEATLTAIVKNSSDALESISVSNVKEKYYVGETFVRPMVTAHYESGITVDVTDEATFLGFDSSSAVSGQVITVSYTDEIEKTTSFTVDIEERPVVTVESITLANPTMLLCVGDTFSFGGTVTAKFSDKSSQDVTSFVTFSGYDMTQAGIYTVTVSYSDGQDNTVTATYSLMVNEATDKTVFAGSYNLIVPMTNLNLFNEYIITFNSDGTGTYERYTKNNEGYKKNGSTTTFTWTKTGNSISVTYVSGDYTDFVNGYRLFDLNSTDCCNANGKYNTNGSVTYGLVNTSTGALKEYTFTKKENA